MLLSVVIVGMMVLQASAGVTYNDDDCTVSGLGVGMIGSEDMALGRHGVLFITSGDLLTTFTQGSAASDAGGVWVLDTRVGGVSVPYESGAGVSPRCKVVPRTWHRCVQHHRQGVHSH